MTAGQVSSVLWPDGRPSGTHRLTDAAADDLELGRVIAAIVGADAPSGRIAARERFARDVLTDLLQDAALIAYRQTVLGDIVDNAQLRAGLYALLPDLEALGDARRGERYRPTAEPGIDVVVRRVAELELLVDVVRRSIEALRDNSIVSNGLKTLRDQLEETRSAPEFQSLERELPSFRATLEKARSVTIGINLGPDLVPASATILDLSDTPIEGRRSLLWRLLGSSSGKDALTPLQRGETGPLGRPNELVRDLRHLLGELVGPLQAALDRYARVSSASIGHIGAELAFLLGVANLVERMRVAGLPMCRPEPAPIDERVSSLIDAYDPVLALDQSTAPTIVTNAVTFDSSARVWVLTGPNRGGKTTYVRTVGLAQVLFQVGLFVAAASARLSPADAIYTHFPTQEQLRPGHGRLDAEAERVAGIFREASPSSVILLNEALAGTSALEALDLARGLVRGLRLLGARAIYVTHLHELAASVNEINATTAGDGAVGSLLAESAENAATPGPEPRADGAATRRTRTFRIIVGAPRGVSFAAEIAEEHGISFSQIAQHLRERGLAQ